MKKMMKKTMALLLAAVMSFGMAATALAAAPDFNQYYTPDTGSATPASADGGVEAVPYVFEDKPLVGGTHPLFIGATQYEAEFTAPSGIDDYGKVSFEDNKVTYTPSREVAEQTVKFTVYAGNDADEWTTPNGIEFTVKVGSAPTAGSDNANLTSLSYQLDSGEKIEIPDFDKDTTTYRVTLPYGTKEGLDFTLSGTTEDANAETEATTETTSYAMREAKLTVTAENGATTKEYTVEFHIAAPDIAPKVEIDGEEYKDGDTVYLKAGETKKPAITIGTSGDNPHGSVGSEQGYSDDKQVLSFMTLQAGVYPNIYNSTQTDLYFVDPDVAEGTTVDIHIEFYKEFLTNWNDDSYTPYEIITLHIVCGSKPEGMPAIRIDYDKEQLTGFEDGAVYTIDGEEVQLVNG